MKFKLLILILFTSFGACKSPHKRSNAVINKSIAHNYQFYKTSVDTASLMVLIDAHGDTQLAISKLKEAAQKYRFNLMALSDVENNTENYLQKIKADINAALINEKIKPRKIIIGGFSGGARMAATYFSTQNCDGLLLCGAGAKVELNKPVALIIGLKDFNFYEQFYKPNSPFVKNMNLFQLVFDGKHEWPPKAELNTAACFLLKKTGSVINTDTIVEQYKKNAAKFMAANRYFRAFKDYEAAYKLASNNKKAKLKNRLAQFVKNKNIEDFTVQLSAEKQGQKDYVSAFYMKNKIWWDRAITKLQKQSKSQNFRESNSAERQKAFIGIAVYSFLNKNKSMPFNDYIKKLIYIYEKLEPKNPDLYFFKAYFNYKAKNIDKAKKLIRKSKDLGIKTKVLRENFPLKFLKHI